MKKNMDVRAFFRIQIIQTILKAEMIMVIFDSNKHILFLIIEIIFLYNIIHNFFFFKVILRKLIGTIVFTYKEFDRKKSAVLG